jgi:hypothetical protein
MKHREEQMKIDYESARKILEEESEQIRSIQVSGVWVDIVKELSLSCQDKNKTMIAMLGTALLAKATAIEVDVFSLQVGTGKSGRSYSARALCKDVLAANASRLGIDLGVTGREPLNNQPFFGKSRITADMKVRTDAQTSLAILLKALTELDKIKAEPKARNALRSFLQVRQRKQVKIQIADGLGEDWGAEFLTQHIMEFVNKDSEGGKRAQAVAAGLCDVLFGPQLVDVRRINDPSSKYPGDIGIKSRNDVRSIARAIEVKDKPVSDGDLKTFIDNVYGSGIRIAAMLAVSSAQPPLDVDESVRWAETRGIRFRVFLGWSEIVKEATYWTDIPGIAVGSAVHAIAKRLEFYEVSPLAIESWQKD